MGKKTIPSLIRLHKWNVDEKRQALAKLVDAEEALKELRRKQEEDLIKEKQTAEKNHTASFTLGAYIDSYIKKREELEAKIAELQKQIEVARDILADAFKELKTYEIVQERHDIEEKKELELKQQKEIDDMASKQFMRNKKGK